MPLAVAAGQSTTMLVGQLSRETQLVGGQQRTTTSKQQHSVRVAPVAGSRQAMQAATVVLPFGKKEPERCVMFVPTTSPHGSMIFGAGKKAMAPSGPSHWMSTVLGQTICGWHWVGVCGQFVTITWKQQQFQ